MQARYYDPVIGRFYSNDPADVMEHIARGNPVHGFNRYGYANNNPYRYTDPDGRFPGERRRERNAQFAVKAAGDAAEMALGKNSPVTKTLQSTADLMAKSTLDMKQAVSQLSSTLKSVSVKKQAENLVSQNGNKSRVTMTSTSQKIEIDLKGASHGGVPTPHTKNSPRNLNAPNQPAYNTKGTEPIATTQQEVRAARKFLEKNDG